MRRIYLNADKSIFYISNFSWDTFSKYLSSDKEILLNLLVLIKEKEGMVYGPVLHKASNRYDKPFEDLYLPTNWSALDRIINATNYLLYEYDFNINPNFNITSVTLSEIMLRTNGNKNVPEEIMDVFGNNGLLYDLVKLAENNIDKMLYLDDVNQVERISNRNINIDKFLWSATPSRS